MFCLFFSFYYCIQRITTLMYLITLKLCLYWTPLALQALCYSDIISIQIIRFVTYRRALFVSISNSLRCCTALRSVVELYGLRGIVPLNRSARHRVIVVLVWGYVFRLNLSTNIFMSISMFENGSAPRCSWSSWILFLVRYRGSIGVHEHTVASLGVRRRFT